MTRAGCRARDVRDYIGATNFERDHASLQPREYILDFVSPRMAAIERRLGVRCSGVHPGVVELSVSVYPRGSIGVVLWDEALNTADCVFDQAMF